ncbi:MAG: MBL fold metallo-hydrolase [Solirubrobacteraceae bacterium]|nr:MBL fold metallo-hydrolase [Solirubrobacteraceae bacterium]
MAPVTPFHDEPTAFPGGLVPVAHGVYAWLQPNGGLGESNAGVVVGEGEALLVDTLLDLPLTQRMLDVVAQRVNVPITTLVNTRAGGEHTWGNQLVAGARIIASERTAEHFHDEHPLALRAFQGAGRVGRRLGLWPRGSSRSTPMECGLNPFDFRGIRPTGPTETFRGDLDLEIGGRQVLLQEVGPAHSPGDTMVLVPDSSVVFAADIMMRGGRWPIMWTGPAWNWISGLDMILTMSPDIVVPGRGRICTVGDVDGMRDLLMWIVVSATALLREGRTPRAATLRLLAGDEVRCGPWRALRGPGGLFITISTIDRHLRGEADPRTRGEWVRTLMESHELTRHLHRGGLPRAAF